MAFFNAQQASCVRPKQSDCQRTMRKNARER
jgi:hypothetical protein